MSKSSDAIGASRKTWGQHEPTVSRSTPASPLGRRMRRGRRESAGLRDGAEAPATQREVQACAVPGVLRTRRGGRHAAAGTVPGLQGSGPRLRKRAGLTIHQRTPFPNANTVRIEIAARRPMCATLRLRHPHGSAPSVDLRLNGRSLDPGRPGESRERTREWRGGDAIDREPRMPLRLERLRHPRLAVCHFGRPHGAGGDAGRCADESSDSRRPHPPGRVAQRSRSGDGADSRHRRGEGRGVAGVTAAPRTLSVCGTLPSRCLGVLARVPPTSCRLGGTAARCATEPLRPIP
jgi:hypothetical protein